MEFEDIDNIIYHKFILEFSDMLASSYNKTHESQLNLFFKNKNLGIVHMKHQTYKIVDEQQWLLAKLKYGI
jgi:hypothetical protein